MNSWCRWRGQRTHGSLAEASLVGHCYREVVLSTGEDPRRSHFQWSGTPSSRVKRTTSARTGCYCGLLQRPRSLLAAILMTSLTHTHTHTLVSCPGPCPPQCVLVHIVRIVLSKIEIWSCDHHTHLHCAAHTITGSGIHHSTYIHSEHSMRACIAMATSSLVDLSLASSLAK